ncbi:MAG TPA: EAL domain-containing protein, partial [Arenimonas sp.]|nr:EAL domain-containing protein [Arenimonas sp.]
DALEQAGEVTVTGTKSVSWMGVPLFLSGEVKGVIALQSYTEDYHYAELDKELVSFVGVHIANALERRLTNENLRKAYAELEHRVTERTYELAHANNELRDQILVRERMELKLKHETLHDALTGLPNRSHLLGRLGRALGRYHNDASRLFAVLFLDLDRFKVVNDSVGHLVGDELLKEAAKRISTCVREPDLVSRLGGDEFAVVLENIADQEDVIIVADRIIRALSAPMRIAGKELFTSASIGIAIVDARYRNPEELLRDADVAMYRAKASGRKKHALFDEGLHEIALKTLDLENDLRRALHRHEFQPFYQPIAQLIDGKVVGFEALMRWNHPERGLLAPGEFLEVAEETGNLEAMDWQIYEQVCIDLESLVVMGTYVTLNVSPVHLRDKTFAERFLALMDRHNVKPQSIKLEVTEGALLEDPEQVASCLYILKKLGVHTVLDDFGTGYSSLSYLHRFPLSGLKIDRSFVNALQEGEAGGSTAIVRAIRLMADSLGL